jgi:hypothetical protein
MREVKVKGREIVAALSEVDLSLGRKERPLQAADAVHGDT